MYVSDEATLQFALKQLNDSALISQYGKMQDIVEDGLILIVNRKRGIYLIYCVIEPGLNTYFNINI